MPPSKAPRLTQLDAYHLVLMLEGKPVRADFAAKLVKRGLATFAGSEVFASEAGKEALKRWGWR